MRVWSIIASIVLFTACNSVASGPRNGYGQGQNPNQGPNQGRYQQPAYLQPEPMRRLPQDDVCQSRMFMGLIGQHEGGIVFSSLPGRTRVVKPAETERNQDDFLADMRPEPPLVQIREYLAGQVLYAPAIRATGRIDELGEVIGDRLTIELDNIGYVTRLSCR